MIAKAYRGTHHPDGKLVIDEASERLGRQIALHATTHDFDVARQVIARAEQEWQREQLTPTGLDDVTIAELDLPDRISEALEDQPHLKTVADLLRASDDELLGVRTLGAF